MIAIPIFYQNRKSGFGKESTEKMAYLLRSFGHIFEKQRNTRTYIKYGKGLIYPCNQLLGKELPNIFLHQNKPLLLDINDCRQLLKLSTQFPTTCKELVTGWPNYIGVKDESSNGIGGIITIEGKYCIPAVFCLNWPDDVKDLLRIFKITN